MECISNRELKAAALARGPAGLARIGISNRELKESPR